MKKMAFFVIPVLMSIMGCGSTPATVAPSTPAAPAPAVPTPKAETKGSALEMDLDAAIKEAAVKMGMSLPARTEVALVSIASSSAQFSEYVISRLEAALVDGGKLIVLDRANLDKIREEQGFHLSGEVDDDSAKAIGKLLGAGAIVTGSFINLGDVYGLSLKAINMTTAVIAVSYPADIAKSTRIETLLASGGGSAGTARTTQTPMASVSMTTDLAAQIPSQTTTVQPAPIPVAPVNTTTPVISSAPAAQTATANPQPAAPSASSGVYKVGDRGPAGGFVFYDKGVVTYGWRYLEAAPDDIPAPIRWGPNNTAVNTTDTAVGTGKANTQRIAPIINRHGEDGAALFCTALSINGYQDWFLPSKDELNLMYVNLKKKGLGGFGDGYYWSSSEYNYFDAWVQRFSDGSQNYSYYYTKGDKDYALPVRAVRAF
ncbi:CsgG/HfaB family protein [Breznakiellaceae bacterium SP9]